jgi:hypothetical protein
MTLRLPAQSKPVTFVGKVTRCDPFPDAASERFEVAATVSATRSSDQGMFHAYCQFVATQLLMKYLP